jgi:hypothetical protein
MNRKGFSRNMSNIGNLRKKKIRNMKKMLHRNCWTSKGSRMKRRKQKREFLEAIKMEN